VRRRAFPLSVYLERLLQPFEVSNVCCSLLKFKFESLFRHYLQVFIGKGVGKGVRFIYGRNSPENLLIQAFKKSIRLDLSSRHILHSISAIVRNDKPDPFSDSPFSHEIDLAAFLAAKINRAPFLDIPENKPDTLSARHLIRYPRK